jgi:hypothetical protein
MNAANYILMSVGGGFFGTICALIIGFVFARTFIRAKFTEMTAQAHESGICPVCNKSAKHDRFIGDEA